MTITTKSRTIHMRIDVKGALSHWNDSEWRNCVRDNNGKMLTPDEVKAGFLDELAQGHLYLPLGDCDNFSFTEGCKGHPVLDEAERGSQGGSQDK